MHSIYTIDSMYLTVPDRRSETAQRAAHQAYSGLNVVRFRNGGELRDHALSFGFSPVLQELRRFWSFSSAPQKAHVHTLCNSCLRPMPLGFFSSPETTACVGANGNNSTTTAVSAATFLEVDER